VVEVFVMSPHFTSALAWEKRDQETRNGVDAPQASAGRRSTGRMLLMTPATGGPQRSRNPWWARGGQAARGSYAGRREVDPIACDNWRRPRSEQTARAWRVEVVEAGE